MRRALLSVAVAIAAVAGVTASGWAIQAAALPPPKPVAQLAADASDWFHEYRFVIDVFHFDRRRTSGACLSGWFAGPRGPKVRASLLSLKGGPLLHATSHGRVTVTAGNHEHLLPEHAAAAAGCTGRLEDALTAAVQNGTHLTAVRAYAANRPAIALRWSRGRDSHITLYLSPRSDDRPLVAVVEVAGRDATARLYLTPIRTRLLKHFHLPVPPSKR